MTVGELTKIVKDYNIPENVTMLSDSGWECSETDMDGVYYSETEHEMVFTQAGDKYDRYYGRPEYKLLHSREDIQDRK